MHFPSTGMIVAERQSDAPATEQLATAITAIAATNRRIRLAGIWRYRQEGTALEFQWRPFSRA